jgi:hypothetical protein
MSAAIRIEKAMMAEVESQLELPELATFLLADFDGRDFEVIAMKRIDRDGYASRSNFHLELPDSARPDLIAWALQSNRCLIEAHSHGAGIAQFSASDHRGFLDWVPHVRWRLGGRPYAALVCSGRDWDGLAWIDPSGREEAIEAIEVIGRDSDEQDAHGPNAGSPPMTGRIIKTTQRSISDV